MTTVLDAIDQVSFLVSGRQIAAIFGGAAITVIVMLLARVRVARSVTWAAFAAGVAGIVVLTIRPGYFSWELVRLDVARNAVATLLRPPDWRLTDARDVVLNILLFVPAASAISILLRKPFVVVAVALASSLLIEFLQEFTGGGTATSDVLMNTLGAAIGVAIGECLSWLRQRTMSHP